MRLLNVTLHAFKNKITNVIVNYNIKIIALSYRQTLSILLHVFFFCSLFLPKPLILLDGLPFLGVDWHDVDATLGGFSSISSSSRSSSS